MDTCSPSSSAASTGGPSHSAGGPSRLAMATGCLSRSAASIPGWWFCSRSVVVTDAHSHSTMATGGPSLSAVSTGGPHSAMAASGPSHSAVAIGAPSHLTGAPYHSADFLMATSAGLPMGTTYNFELLCQLLFLPQFNTLPVRLQILHLLSPYQYQTVIIIDTRKDPVTTTICLSLTDKTNIQKSFN